MQDRNGIGSVWGWPGSLLYPRTRPANSLPGVQFWMPDPEGTRVRAFRCEGGGDDGNRTRYAVCSLPGACASVRERPRSILTHRSGRLDQWADFRQDYGWRPGQAVDDSGRFATVAAMCCRRNTNHVVLPDASSGRTCFMTHTTRSSFLLTFANSADAVPGGAAASAAASIAASVISSHPLMSAVRSHGDRPDSRQSASQRARNWR